MISFIVPVYKTPLELLRNCLDSILRYRLPKELLCVLDSPGDPCQEMLEEYANAHDCIRVLVNSKNMGVSYSRNRGIDVAKGEYLAFVDADDEIVAEAYEIAMEFSSNERLPGCSLIANNPSHKDFNGLHYGGKLKASLADRTSGLVVAQAFEWAVYPAVYEKKFLQVHGIRFLEDRRYGEDFVFVVQFLSKCKDVGVINENGYRSVGHEQSVCHQHSSPDKYVQGILSAIDVLQIVNACSIPKIVRSWYVVKIMNLALLDAKVSKFVSGDDLYKYRRVYRKLCGLLTDSFGDVTSFYMKAVLAFGRRFVAIRFMTLALKALNKFGLQVA